MKYSVLALDQIHKVFYSIFAKQYGISCFKNTFSEFQYIPTILLRMESVPKSAILQELAYTNAIMTPNVLVPKNAALLDVDLFARVQVILFSCLEK